MATAEDDLPDELDKLQITPKLPQLKPVENNCTLDVNPFLEGDRKSILTTSEETSSAPLSLTVKCAAHRSRGLRARRASEGMADERKHLHNSTADEVESTNSPPSAGVLKKSLKKSAPSSVGTCRQRRRLVLREPILKALQTCLRSQSSVRRSVVTSAPNVQISDSSVLATRGMHDFRDLINECNSLLTEDVEFSGQLNKLSLCVRNSKNFTTMQKTHTSPKHVVGLCNDGTYHKQQQILKSRKTSEADGSCIEDAHYINKSASYVARNSSTSLPEQANTSARCNTSCSQQAGNSVTAAACDDVTIDELASYFDTFVHIPKKMSSMAEMMYI